MKLSFASPILKHCGEVLYPQLEEVIGRMTDRIKDGTGVRPSFGCPDQQGHQHLRLPRGGALWPPRCLCCRGWRPQHWWQHQDKSCPPEGDADSALLRYKLMAKALTNFPDRQARLLAIPSPDLSLSSPVFKEAFSSHLLLPSLAMREGVWHGREVPGGGVAIDLFGVSIMTSHHIPGDSWRKRHNTVKQHLMAEAALAGWDCEIHGLFSNLLPAALTEEGGDLASFKWWFLKG